MNNWKKFIISLLFFGFTILFFGRYSVAQRSLQFEQYMYNQLQYNPAYAGTDNGLCGSLLHNSQWVGFDGAPQSQSLQVHSPIGMTNVGLGLSLTRETMDVVSNTSGFISYAYRIPLGNMKLSLGVQAGLVLIDENLSQLTTSAIGDQQYMQDFHKLGFNVGAGFFLYSKSFYIGGSIPRLVDNRVDYWNGTGKSDFDPLSNPYFLASGYVFETGKSLKIKPSVLFKHLKNSPATMDFNLNILAKDALGFGLSYRSDKSCGAMAEIFLKGKYRIGYAYHLSLNEIRKYNDGTHEIMVGFCLTKDPISYQSPRYF